MIRMFFEILGMATFLLLMDAVFGGTPIWRLLDPAYKEQKNDKH